MRRIHPEGEKSKEDFWVKAERLYYCALISYIFFELPEEEQNFSTLITMIDESETREDDETYQNPIDVLFEELKQEKPECFAVRQYKKYKLAAGKTAKSILISCGARLAPFDIGQVRDLMEYDELELEKIGDRKTALFVIISDTNKTFNFIVALLYTQLFNLLCDRADDKYNGELPVPVRCLLDEFANIGQIPQFQQLIATIRSRKISANIILQAQSQLKAIYKDDADTIYANCDSKVFLGGEEEKTLQTIMKRLGKETISLSNYSRSRGSSSSDGTNYQTLGKDLLSMDELATLPGGKCICMIRGERPFFSDKFDITKHPMYQYLSDYKKSNAFDIRRLLRSHLVIRPDKEFNFYETDIES